MQGCPTKGFTYRRHFALSPFRHLRIFAARRGVEVHHEEQLIAAAGLDGEYAVVVDWIGQGSQALRVSIESSFRPGAQVFGTHVLYEGLS